MTGFDGLPEPIVMTESPERHVVPEQWNYERGHPLERSCWCRPAVVVYGATETVTVFHRSPQRADGKAHE